MNGKAQAHLYKATARLSRILQCLTFPAFVSTLGAHDIGIIQLIRTSQSEVRMNEETHMKELV
jgi:hypothetical protein